MKNWVSEYDMACAPAYHFGLFGSIYFGAVVLGSLIFPPLADKIGRRPVAMLGMLLAGIAQTILLFSSSLNFSYFLIFLMGLSMPMRVFVGFIYAMEFLPIKNTEMATGVTLGCDGLGIAIGAIWFMLISKDWRSFMAFATVLCYVGVLYTWCLMPESPKFLVSRGRYHHARKVITKMMRRNKGEFCFEDTEQELATQCLDGHYMCLW